MIRVTTDQAVKCLQEVIDYLKIYDVKIDSIYMNTSSNHISKLDHSGELLEKEEDDSLIILGYTKKSMDMTVNFKDRIL
jgi:hypothetical protein